MGDVVLSYADGNFYAQYGDDESSKKVLGEISKGHLIEALAYSGLGLTLQSTPEQIYIALKAKFPGDENLLIPAIAPSQYITVSGNTIKLTTTGTNAGGYQLYYAYGGYHDISKYSKVSIKGSIYTQAVGDADGSRCQAVISLVNAAGNEISLVSHSGTGTFNFDTEINVEGYTGQYRLRVGLSSYNDYRFAAFEYAKYTM